MPYQEKWFTEDGKNCWLFVFKGAEDDGKNNFII
jgi:hypothetical protein